MKRHASDATTSPSTKRLRSKREAAPFTEPLVCFASLLQFVPGCSSDQSQPVELPMVRLLIDVDRLRKCAERRWCHNGMCPLLDKDMRQYLIYMASSKRFPIRFLVGTLRLDGSEKPFRSYARSATVAAIVMQAMSRDSGRGDQGEFTQATLRPGVTLDLVPLELSDVSAIAGPLPLEVCADLQSQVGKIRECVRVHYDLRSIPLCLILNALAGKAPEEIVDIENEAQWTACVPDGLRLRSLCIDCAH